MGADQLEKRRVNPAERYKEMMKSETPRKVNYLQPELSTKKVMT